MTDRFADVEDPWAWAQTERIDRAPLDVSATRVTAVLVAFDAARWLPATLASLAASTVRPHRLIAIDNGSTDATRTLLERARDQGVLDAVYEGRSTFGFGAAVKAALRKDRMALTAETGVIALDDADDRHWLWLLHDDAAPEPQALHKLLDHVLRDGSIDITGPKLVLPRRRHGGQPISEVGVSISGTGRRDLALDTGEIDQGQQDKPTQRLGVSTCAMLVRAAVWQDLDGLDPALPVFRDGVEFGWRAHLNGYRVVTTPGALVVHRQVGRAGLRPRGLTGRRPGQVDRLLGMLVVAGHAPGAMLPLVWLRLVLSCLARAFGYLVGKVPGRSLDEMLAVGSFIAHPRRIRDLRARTAQIDPAPGTAEVVARLRPPWWNSLSVAAEVLSSAMSDRYRSVAGDLDAASLDELTTDEFSSVVDDRPRYPWLNPIILATLAAAVGSVIAARSLIGLGSLVGPALLPAQDSLGRLWDTAIQPIAGAPGQIAPPWLAVAALGSTVLAGQPEWFSTLLVAGVVPLALISAYPLARRLIVDQRIRLWVAVTYALLPVLLGASNQGRITLGVFAIGVPLLVAAGQALVLRRVRTPEAWRGAWGAAVVLVVLIAFEPSVLILALIFGAIGAVMLRRTPRKIGRIGIALGVPLLVLAPWLPTLILDPGRLFVGPDAALDGAGRAPQVWGLLIGTGIGRGLPPIWVSGVVFGMIWVVALIGLARRAERRAVTAAWLTAALTLATAVLLSRIVVSVPPYGAEVRPWVGAYLFVGFAALLLAGGIGVDGLRERLNRRSFTWLQPITVLAGALAAVITLGAGAWWMVGGANGPIERSRLDSIPPYVLNAMATPQRPRVLAVDLTGNRAAYSVLSDGQVRLGAADRGFAYGGSKEARAIVDDLVVRLVAGTADSDIAPQLADLGIGYVWVSGAADEVTSRIGNTPGLGTASGTERGTVWTLAPAVSRAVLSAGTETSPVAGSTIAIPAGPEGRLLKLGESADSRWRAEIDGRSLDVVSAGWQQAFAVPAAGGTVTYQLRSPMSWLMAGQGLILLVAAVLAAPGIRRPDVRDPTKTARRAATLSETV